MLSPRRREAEFGTPKVSTAAGASGWEAAQCGIRAVSAGADSKAETVPFSCAGFCGIAARAPTKGWPWKPWVSKPVFGYFCPVAKVPRLSETMLRKSSLHSTEGFRHSPSVSSSQASHPSPCRLRQVSLVPLLVLFPREHPFAREPCFFASSLPEGACFNANPPDPALPRHPLCKGGF